MTVSLNLFSVLQTVRILKTESEQITKTLDLLICELVNAQNPKVEELENVLKKLVEDF